MVFLNLERILGCYFMEEKEKEKLKILKRERKHWMGEWVARCLQHQEGMSLLKPGSRVDHGEALIPLLQKASFWVASRCL